MNSSQSKSAKCWQTAKWSLLALIVLFVIAIVVKVRLIFLFVDLMLIIAILAVGAGLYLDLFPSADEVVRRKKTKESLPHKQWIESRGSYLPSPNAVPPPAPPKTFANSESSETKQ